MHDSILANTNNIQRISKVTECSLLLAVDVKRNISNETYDGVVCSNLGYPVAVTGSGVKKLCCYIVHHEGCRICRVSL